MPDEPRPFDFARASDYERDPSESPGFVFWRRFLEWQRALNALLRPVGLTQPQFSILASIGWLCGRAARSDPPAPVYQQTVADFTGMDRMLVSQIVRKLAAEGLVDRAPSEADRRTVSLGLTRAGGAALDAALPMVEAHDRGFFGVDGGDGATR